MNNLSDTLITDRADSNTYYNYTDLNRVEAATGYLANLLIKYGYPLILITKTNWSMIDFPTASQMSRYLNNIKRCAVYSYPDIELPISMNNIYFEDANNIEKYLQQIQEMIDLMAEGFKYLGTFSSGQTLLNQNVNNGLTWAQIDAKNWTWAEWDTNDWFNLLYD